MNRPKGSLTRSFPSKRGRSPPHDRYRRLPTPKVSQPMIHLASRRSCVDLNPVRRQKWRNHLFSPVSTQLSPQNADYHYTTCDTTLHASHRKEFRTMSHHNKLDLYFGGTPSPGLYRTVFLTPDHVHPIIGVRGPLFNQPSFPFIWCTSSIALSILFVAAVAYEARGEKPLLPLLEGGRASPAGALGKLMNKGVRSWLHDIFGSDPSGRSLLQKMILLSNARGRRQGPITATLRSSFLSAGRISIYLNGVNITADVVSLDELQSQLEIEFANRKSSRYGKTSVPTTCAA